MLLLSFVRETETYCKSKHFSQELPVRLPLKIWSHREGGVQDADSQHRPICVLYLLCTRHWPNKKEKKKTRTNETCFMKPLTIRRFSLCWTSSVTFFLSEKSRRMMITESQQSRTHCAAPATAERLSALCQEARPWGRGMHAPTHPALIRATRPNYTAGLWKNPRCPTLGDEHKFVLGTPFQLTSHRSNVWMKMVSGFPEPPQWTCPHYYPSLVRHLFTPVWKVLPFMAWAFFLSAAGWGGYRTL